MEQEIQILKEKIEIYKHQMQVAASKLKYLSDAKSIEFCEFVKKEFNNE